MRATRGERQGLAAAGASRGYCARHQSEAEETNGVDKFNQTVSSLTSARTGLQKCLTTARVYAEGAALLAQIIYPGFEMCLENAQAPCLSRGDLKLLLC